MHKGKKLLFILHRSKFSLAFFSLFLSFILIIGTTYAWYTESDERINRIESHNQHLSAKIEENFQTVDQWSPGTTKRKEIRVKNDGEVAAIVRLSLKEYFLYFEVDTTDNHREEISRYNGNGNLTVYGQPTNAIDVSKVATWKKGNTYELSASIYYKAKEDVLERDYVHGQNRTLPLKAIELNFHPNKIFEDHSKIPPNESRYWYYEKGFFYYSEALKPGEITTNLLDSVSLSTVYGNPYKGALYKLVPKMDAHHVTHSLISDWELKPTDYVYNLYQGLL
ncbi:BsaA family SipW-dependent biofilm matrix protein [Candidatus Enterococcus ferrettii]|uniref:Alternate signal-mediated exported protein, CPF_0494 family n=1 Tax=Candidatus Enterococcus ferrettii TaxID=2815324 RepID=A0ABV0EVK2_9ENTE|nr:BsaA family SipW-dependent biofilm matrix protein [Enterococcus sp. 665A]MBO1342882.1 hypothetical protein [Enterococcus sp. 665A]